MSFNRTKYDQCAGRQAVNDSVAVGLYAMNTPVICSSCYEQNPEIRLQKNGVSLNTGVDWRFFAGPVDVESDLFNINRTNSRCPPEKYTPNCTGCECEHQGPPCGNGVTAGCFLCSAKHDANPNNNNNNGGMRKRGQRCGDNNLADQPNCGRGLDPEHTRLSNPPCTNRGVGINRFNPLCHDPQNHIMFPGEYEISSRIIAKDAHRACIPFVNINSMNPPPRPQVCPQITPTCGVFTQALRQYDVCG